jgi:phosphoglucosamine mutase
MAFCIGRICAYQAMESEEKPVIAIGKDTRISGDMLQGALVAGICSSGADAHCLGVLSTPALAYLTCKLGAAAGIMISASHNPIEDNGLKVFSSSGYKLSDQKEAELEELYFATDDLPRPQGAKLGRVIDDGDSAGLYLEFLKNSFPGLAGMHVAIDCGHGAVYRLAPEIYRALGAKVTVLNNEPNGVNINVKCGSTDPSALQEMVKQSGAHVGLAFDGDADRLIAVDDLGEIVDGDLLMLLFALDLKQKDRLDHNTFVTTVMSNGGLEMAANLNGIKLVRTVVGDRYVLEKMLQGGFKLGGEQSGHIIFSDYATTGDGLFSALKLTEFLQEAGRPLSSYKALITRLPQVTVNCRVGRKDGWEDIPAFQRAIEDAYETIGSFGRVLVRPSGTEPVMRVMVEGEKDEAALKLIATGLAAILTKELN